MAVYQEEVLQRAAVRASVQCEMAAKVRSFHAWETGCIRFLFLNQTLKLAMAVSAVPRVMITDMKERKLKEFTLAFAAKRTHSSVTGRAVYFRESHLCSTST